MSVTNYFKVVEGKVAKFFFFNDFHESALANAYTYALRESATGAVSVYRAPWYQGAWSDVPIVCP